MQQSGLKRINHILRIQNIGKVTKLPNGVTYFPGLQQPSDPSVASVTSLNGLNTQFSNKAIADSQGRLLLVNPAPGQVGTEMDRGTGASGVGHEPDQAREDFGN